eukprot:g11405.t1
MAIIGTLQRLPSIASIWCIADRKQSSQNPPDMTGSVSHKVEVEDDQMDHASVMKRYKEQVPKNEDWTAPRRESVFSLPNFCKQAILPMLNDERDYVAAEFLVNHTFIVIPLVVYSWYYPSNLWMLIFTVGKLVALGTRFFLTLHVTSHRKLFKDTYWPLNSFAEVVLCPLMGMPSGGYFIHHCMMHHVENNVFPYDITSTMPHQRNTCGALASYIFRYFTHTAIYLPYYAFKRGQYKLVVYHMLFANSYWLVFYLTWRINPVFATWFFLVSYIITGMALMKGNFAQHMFICPDDPFSNYRLAFNCISQRHNTITFNDGYHIIHHANSRLHWSEMMQYFEDNIEKFARNDAFIFQGINNDKVFNYVFTDNYKQLYSHWVQLTPTRRSLEQFEALCRYRLQPIHQSKKSPSF